MTEPNGYTLISDVALFAEAQVLFVKYANPEDYDGQTGWFLPDVSIKYLENPEKAAERILKDQLGLVEILVSLDHIESFRGNNGTWHLAFHYRADLDSQPNMRPNVALGAAQWFALSALPSKDDVAHHGWSLNTVKKMLAKD